MTTLVAEPYEHFQTLVSKICGMVQPRLFTEFAHFAKEADLLAAIILYGRQNQVPPWPVATFTPLHQPMPLENIPHICIITASVAWYGNLQEIAYSSFPTLLTVRRWWYGNLLSCHCRSTPELRVRNPPEICSEQCIMAYSSLGAIKYPQQYSEQPWHQCQVEQIHPDSNGLLFQLLGSGHTTTS